MTLLTDADVDEIEANAVANAFMDSQVTVQRLIASLRAAREYARADARCPCCDDVTCYEGCTYPEDAPQEYARMALARAALGGKP